MKGTGERWAEESGHDDGRDDDEGEHRAHRARAVPTRRM
jgi:hypothetical protein